MNKLGIGWKLLVALSCLASSANAFDRPVGSFNAPVGYEVSGDLYVKDINTFTIKNFYYDGQGPDVFFIVGLRTDQPNALDAIPVPLLSRSTRVKRRYNYNDRDIPILGRFTGNDIDLALPEGIDVRQVRWISLFCRDYNVDFGHVLLQRNSQFHPRRTN